MKIVITIDGPSGSGKSTLAKNLSRNLPNFTLVDSGSYFRWVTYLCLKDNVDLYNRREVYNHVKEKLDLDFSDNKKTDEMVVKYDKKKINDFIFTTNISRQVSEPAQNYLLRKLIRKKLRKLAEKCNVVLAGRDTGSYTFPDAGLKIFLTADIEKRAKRRFDELKKTGREVDFEEVLYQMKARDRRDLEEKDSPLVKPRGAVLIDNSNLTCKQTLEKVLAILKKKKIA